MEYFGMMMIVVLFVFIGRLSNENKEARKKLSALEEKVSSLEKGLQEI